MKPRKEMPVIAATRHPGREAFQRVRERTDRIFALIQPEAYTERPIPLRHPFVFYDGHLDAFNWNTLFRNVLGQPSFNPAFDELFARGIDPDVNGQAPSGIAWPSQDEIRSYKREVNNYLYDFLDGFDPEHAPHAWLENGHLLHILLEHELMHQETLLYLVHQLPAALKHRPEAAPPGRVSARVTPQEVFVPRGVARLGTDGREFPFVWDNERSLHPVEVPAFTIDAHNVTNGQFLAFVEAGGYQSRAFWDDPCWDWACKRQVAHPFFWKKQGDAWVFRGLFGDEPLELDAPVLVTHAEAQAYLRFVGKRLPTEAEWHRAAFGDEPERLYPWGNEPPGAAHANADFQHWGPVPIGSSPQGASPLGVHDLVGNGWEWTSTPFSPFPGFRPDPAYPGYSADFFDGRHLVLKGGSWATDAKLLRRSFRNWFYGTYPYVYATFRGVN